MNPDPYAILCDLVLAAQERDARDSDDEPEAA